MLSIFQSRVNLYWKFVRVVSSDFKGGDCPPTRCILYSKVHIIHSKRQRPKSLLDRNKSISVVRLPPIGLAGGLDQRLEI